MLYKTTIVIWSDFHPGQMEMSHLAREAESGDAYCAKQEIVAIDNPAADVDAPDMEFFHPV